LSTAVKHHWFGDTSPWTEQQLDYYYNFNAPRSRPAKVVIFDRENPPPPRSDSSLEMDLRHRAQSSRSIGLGGNLSA
jgi:hypothetical protein